MKWSEINFRAFKGYVIVMIFINLVRWWWSNYENAWAIGNTLFFVFILIAFKWCEHYYELKAKRKEE